MQKVILDTNVIVSSLIQRSCPYYIVFDHVLERDVRLCLSDALLDEYREVLSRPKFARVPNFESNAEIVLNRISEIALFYEPQIRLDIIKDASDNKLLELADESNADFLITGNTTDFRITQYKNTRILSPRDFWENFSLQL
jgi:putative PIN family toxin of toxin-antitoxin system